MKSERSPQRDLTAGQRVKGADEKFCESCCQIIKIKAALCPHCGMPQRVAVNKTPCY